MGNNQGRQTKKQLLVVFLSLLLSVAIIWLTLFAGKVIINGFNLFQQYPLASFISDFLDEENSIPMWLSNYLGGFPYSIGQYTPFTHFLLFSNLFDYLSAFNIAILLGFLTGSLAMYLFARALKLSPAASIIAAVIYAFSHLNIWLGSMLALNIFLPRIYFANNIKFVDSDDKTAFEELLGVKDFNKTTLIECTKPECIYATHKPNSKDTITINEIKSGHLEISTSTQNPRWLIYSESNLPTWEVRINDNQELTPIYTANYLFQAIYIPPGDNQITFTHPGIWGRVGYNLENILTR